MDTHQPTDAELAWKKLSEEHYRARGGFRKLMTRNFLLPNGNEVVMDIANTPTVVLVLAFVDDEHILVVDQYRPGPERVMTELPGGYVDEGEESHAAAARELEEETGHQAATMEYIGSSYPDGYSTLRKDFFVARGCAPTSQQQLDENEIVRVRTIPFSTYVETAAQGNTTGGVDALFHYFHHNDQLK